jgi:hypothetical protein
MPDANNFLCSLDRLGQAIDPRQARGAPPCSDKEGERGNPEQAIGRGQLSSCPMRLLLFPAACVYICTILYVFYVFYVVRMYVGM